MGLIFFTFDLLDYRHDHDDKIIDDLTNCIDMMMSLSSDSWRMVHSDLYHPSAAKAKVPTRARNAA